jgi:Cu+-exporting ATPase
VLDPVCGMTVDVAQAEADGLTMEHDGKTYAFCRSGCLRAFQEEPQTYAAKAEQAHAISVPQAKGLPVIDEGMRRWYESCSLLPVRCLPRCEGGARRRASGQG